MSPWRRKEQPTESENRASQQIVKELLTFAITKFILRMNNHTNMNRVAIQWMLKKENDDYQQTRGHRTKPPSRQRCLLPLLLLRSPPSSMHSGSWITDHDHGHQQKQWSDLKPSSSTRLPRDPRPPILPVFILTNRKNTISR